MSEALEPVTLRPDASFTAVFSHALRGNPCTVVALGEAAGRLPEVLPVHEWLREADTHDLDLLTHCLGPTIDIGCGPGRLAAALAQQGRTVLGIDVVHEAVGQTRERGVPALHRDVFAPLPGEGRWSTALLADGNVGIGGDPVALLARAGELIHRRGRIVVELSPPGVSLHSMWAVLECEGQRSRPFRWAVLGCDDVAVVAADAGLSVAGLHAFGPRWCAVLEVR